MSTMGDTVCMYALPQTGNVSLHSRPEDEPLGDVELKRPPFTSGEQDEDNPSVGNSETVPLIRNQQDDEIDNRIRRICKRMEDLGCYITIPVFLITVYFIILAGQSDTLSEICLLGSIPAILLVFVIIFNCRNVRAARQADIHRPESSANGSVQSDVSGTQTNSSERQPLLSSENKLPQLTSIRVSPEEPTYNPSSSGTIAEMSKDVESSLTEADLAIKAISAVATEISNIASDIISKRENVQATGASTSAKVLKSAPAIAEKLAASSEKESETGEISTPELRRRKLANPEENGSSNLDPSSPEKNLKDDQVKT